MSYLVQILKHPATIIASIVVGIFLGQQFPVLSLKLTPVAEIYISLLKMIASFDDLGRHLQHQQIVE